MTHATDIVAYTYHAELLCPSCVVGNMVSDEHNAQSETMNNATHYLADAETNLDAMAKAVGIDRYNEHSYDSDDFPKVVFSSQANDTDWEHCDQCADCIDHDTSDCQA